MLHARLSPCGVALLVLSCQHLAATGSTSSARGVATVLAQVAAPIPGGVAGGRQVLFVGSPLDGQVRVLSRSTGASLGTLPQPAKHFALPLIVRAIGPARIAVLDCGGFPAPGKVEAEPTLYEYEYRDDDHAFAATLARTVNFSGKRIGFAEEFVALGGGEYLVPDAVYGAIWRVTAEGSVVPALAPKSYAPADAIPSMVFCATMPKASVDGLPFLFTDSTIPGVAGIAVREGTVYFYSSCTAALYRVPLASLTDAREPWQRAADIQRIAGKPAEVPVEELLELQFNPYDASDRFLYAADALQLRLIRIDPVDGRREVVADDAGLFNFPASLGFLPPEPGQPSSVIVLSNQQHRDPMLNPAISAPQLQLPYLITRVTLAREAYR